MLEAEAEAEAPAEAGPLGLLQYLLYMLVLVLGSSPMSVRSALVHPLSALILH